MSNAPFTAGSTRALEAIAEMFLWAGWDRAADDIYAAIEAATDCDADAESDTWADVFDRRDTA